MLGTIAIVMGVVVVGILGFAATRPNSFRIQRKQTINAAPARIYGLIDDYRNWAKWSPYEKLDPTMKKTFSGADHGKGAVYMWAGNSKAGEGRMEIIDAAAPSLVRIKLDFLKPFEGHNIAEFTLNSRGESTEVTWAMHGPMPFMLKLMSVFVNMDNMLGKEFAEGLGNLKSIAESNVAVANHGA